jgi:hypothetical protein
VVTAPPDDVWLPVLARRLGGPVTVTGREPLAGGYVADSVFRVELQTSDATRSVVVKRASAVEVAAMRALAVVRAPVGPGLLAAGRDAAGDWLVVPYLDGPALAEGTDVPAEIWTALARVHAHWLGRRPRGIPVADGAWWRELCRDRVRPHLVAAAARTGDPACSVAATALGEWAEDPRLHAAMAVLPRTLVHGDAHRGNMLRTDGAAVLIDWGNARVAPPGYDLAVLRAQGAVDDTVYRRTFAELAGPPDPRLSAVELAWSQVRANVGYLGFAADHLGADRVAEMTAAAATALTELGRALGTGPRALHTDTQHADTHRTPPLR